MGEFTFLLICGAIFILVMPFFAIWNIWTLLQKIEKHNQSINDQLVKMLKKEI